MSRRKFCDRDIEGFLNIPSGSEDEQDFSDAQSEDDIEKLQSTQIFLSEPLSDVESSLCPQRHQCSSPVNEVIENRQPEISDPQPSTSGMTSGTTAGTSTRSRAPRRSSTMSNAIGHRSIIPGSEKKITQRKKRRFIWKKTSFQSPPFTFTGNTNLHSPIIDFETPLQYFLWFFDDELPQHIVEEMHKFSVQKYPSKPFTITTNELKKFIGVCVIMSYLRLFYHLLDVTLINCSLLYRRVGEQQHTPTPMKQRDFKFEVGKSLCMLGLSINKKRGRPSLSDEIDYKRQKPNTSFLPPRYVRRDGLEHFDANILVAKEKHSYLAKNVA